jgi:hypothetical protein
VAALSAHARRRLLAGVACLAVTAAVATPAGEPVTLPIRIVENFPVVTAIVQGQELPLMYDLGSDASLALPQEVLERLATRPDNGTHRWSDAKGNILESPKFGLSLIELGGLAFHDVTGHVQRSDPSYPASSVFQQGMIGEPFFRGYKVVLDYVRGLMTLIPDTYGRFVEAGCRGAVVPFLPEWGGAPVTGATTDLGDLVMVWDTGAPVSVVRRSYALAHGADASGKIHATKAFELGGVDFGPLELRMFDYEEPRGTDGFVGRGFFAVNVVCIDMLGKALRIRRS